jgi:DNA invertase Pin-like site-specific DNA recombinase
VTRRRELPCAATSKKPLRALGYVRVSTAEQAGSGLGMEAQRQAVEDACDARGWELVDVQVDAGISASATTRSRPALDAVLAALALGEAELLVVAKLDRLARSLTHYARLVELATAQGWRLVALDTPEASTAQGEAMQAITAVFAQLERRLISERTKEALQAARSRGVQLGRPVAVAAGVETTILDLWRRRHLSANAIARELDSLGVPTPGRGKSWRPATVTAVLRRHGATVRPVGRPSKRRVGEPKP